MWRSCQGQLSHKERAIGAVRCKKEGMLLQPLRWFCMKCVIHHERDVPEEQHHTYMWREQAIIEWSWHVSSIVACCHSAKLCAHAAQHRIGQRESDSSLVLVYYRVRDTSTIPCQIEFSFLNMICKTVFGDIDLLDWIFSQSFRYKRHILSHCIALNVVLTYRLALLCS